MSQHNRERRAFRRLVKPVNVSAAGQLGVPGHPNTAATPPAKLNTYQLMRTSKHGKRNIERIKRDMRR